MSYDQQPHFRWIARHEAAHVVVAGIEGLTVKGVHLAPHPTEPGFLAYTELDGLLDRDSLVPVTRVLLAGCAYEEMITPLWDLGFADHDREEAYRMRRIAPEFGLVVNLAEQHRHVRRLLRQHATAIDLLSLRLIEEHEARGAA